MLTTIAQRAASSQRQRLIESVAGDMQHSIAAGPESLEAIQIVILGGNRGR